MEADNPNICSTVTLRDSPGPGKPDLRFWTNRAFMGREPLAEEGVMKEGMSQEMIDALSYWTRDALFSLGGSDETLTGVHLHGVADGSGSWAVLAETYDRDGAEHTYETIVNRHGAIVSVGELPA